MSPWHLEQGMDVAKLSRPMNSFCDNADVAMIDLLVERFAHKEPKAISVPRETRTDRIGKVVELKREGALPKEECLTVEFLRVCRSCGTLPNHRQRAADR
jgi:hypothetical protein